MINTLLVFMLLVVGARAIFCAGRQGISQSFVCIVDGTLEEAPSNMDDDDGVGGCPEYVLGDNSCRVLSGRALTIRCTTPGYMLYKEDVLIGTRHKVYATQSDSGVYYCRNNGTTLPVYGREIIFEPDPLVTAECNLFYDIVKFNGSDCCTDGTPIWFPYQFNVFCDNCSVFINHQWENHIGVDLGLHLSRADPNTTIHTLEAQNNVLPYKVFPDSSKEIKIKIKITITNGSYSDMLCLQRSYTLSPTLYATASVNQTTMVPAGQGSATLQFAYGREGSMHVEVRLSNGTTYRSNCSQSSCIGDLSIAPKPTHVISRPIYVANLTLSLITNAHNGSTVSFYLLYNGAVQWRSITTLMLLSISTSPSTTSPAVPAVPSVPAVPMFSTVPSVGSDKSKLSIGVGVAFVMSFFIVGVFLLLLLVWITCTRKKKAVSLKGDSLQMQASIITSSQTAVSVQSYYNLEVALVETPAKNGISIRRVKSMSSADAERKNQAEKHSKQPRIYISYSEDKLQWVIEYLKPIIQKLISEAEVTIHSNDMIAGYPISEERMRLIVEANKVVIVCSPKYEESSWCQYELQKSVHKDPSLKAGRIVVILCDGCSKLPAVISEAASISDTDHTFESKLLQVLQDKNTLS